MTAHLPDDVAHHQDKPPHRGWRIALLMTLLIGAFYLLREHWSHVVGAWPYLLLLACPLMHLLHRHPHHSHHAPRDAGDRS